ncbi:MULTISPECIES: TIGR00341 family protein [unclassified Coleofasciculus]|uniref:TIGR00341 family protein n=1 Tax=unclassified Coleofasciculus TaxID=2692782 RepID=UPI00187E0027|nr:MULTISPECIES: TIGR00341 family protein [unclassified Coleofasciculus]MBE9129731.1 TIGR00341 family protein [Coleofasciculus sp. LEGE 07081]MBE9151154.1 TIGR00341 family protein [Coleofasciculus sp. LEGE 07092]
MNLRLLEVFLPNEKAEQVQELLSENSLVGIWQTDLSNHQTLIRILLSAEEAEAVIEQLETHFAQVDSFRIILLSIEASIPRPSPPEKTGDEQKEQKLKQELEPQISRINRQELYEDISPTVALTGNHILMVLLSTIIAAIGLLRDNGTILIGAMVIAPLLGPNMALSLATTLGDTKLALRAVKVGSVGMFAALCFSIFLGYVFEVSPEIPEIAFRTNVGVSDVILAFASGIAGALSFTAGATNALVGVMVAVALLPPLVTVGLLLGSGYGQVAVGAILLFLINLICLNLAGIVTFSVQKLHPGKWWEAYKARKLTQRAFWLWFVLLSVLIIGILFWKRNYQIM